MHRSKPPPIKFRESWNKNGLWWENKFPQQHFLLSRELLNAVSPEEINATYADMEKLGLARPPYEEFDVQYPKYLLLHLEETPGHKIFQRDENDRYIMVTDPNLEGATPLVFRYLHGQFFDIFFPMHLPYKGKRIALAGGWSDPKTYTVRPRPETENDGNLQMIRFSSDIYKLLIVLLATKNAEKVTKKNKLLGLGVGAAKDPYLYTTSIHVGRVMEQTEASGEHTGVKKRPHLRRGHIRHQRHGPGFEYIRDIFIEPCFINADEKWIGERTAYNVSL